MPVMDGPDATKAIRDLGVTCPIFGVTGNTLDMDIQVLIPSLIKPSYPLSYPLFYPLS